MRVTIAAPAKINLALDILGKRDDGFHLVKMLMQAVDLCDTVSVKVRREPGIALSCPGLEEVPEQENTAYRAAALFLKETPAFSEGVSIKIKKRIPMMAGLAGGSADAAGVLFGLNELAGRPYTMDRLCDFGGRIGSDVPFCLQGGTMVAEGTGTLLSPMPPMPACTIVLARPPQGVSTAGAYAAFDRLEEPQHPDFDRTALALYEGVEELGRHLFNVFEQVVALPDVVHIRQVLLDNGAAGACMTGTGSTVFGLFADKGEAEHCAGVLRAEYERVFVTQPVSHGCVVDD